MSLRSLSLTESSINKNGIIPNFELGRVEIQSIIRYIMNILEINIYFKRHKKYKQDDSLK